MHSSLPMVRMLCFMCSVLVIYCLISIVLVTKSSFHVDEQNLLEKLSQMSIFFNRQTGTSTFSVDVANRPHNVNAILQLIKGLSSVLLFFMFGDTKF